MQAPEGPQPLLGLGWGPRWPPPSPTVPTAASSSASSCDETPLPPPSAYAFFAATGVEGSMFYPPPRRRRNVAQGAKRRTGLAPKRPAFLQRPLPHFPLGNLSRFVFPGSPIHLSYRRIAASSCLSATASCPASCRTASEVNFRALTTLLWLP